MLQLPASKNTVSFGKEAWGEDLKIFYPYTRLIHAVEAYLLSL